MSVASDSTLTQPPAAKDLRELVAGFVRSSEILESLQSTRITGIQLDSRLVTGGDVFIALFGRNVDAREFVPQVIRAGAAAVLVEAGGEWSGLRWVDGTPVLAIDALSKHTSALAGRFYDNPSARCGVIGITGTNGKTSCAAFCAQALASLGLDPATIGTLGYGRPGALSTTVLTTPDAVFTQRAMAELIDSGVDAIVMEVSSVGLHQRRVQDVSFDTALFTNLSRDHLDYHGSMEAYGANKKKLFAMPGLRHAVINLDDDYGLSIIDGVAEGVDCLTYSLVNAKADVFARELNLHPAGLSLGLATPVGDIEISIGLMGDFNASNILAVAASVIAFCADRALPSGALLDADSLQRALNALRPVAGRMQIVEAAADITVVVDYAHTPDALRSALVGLRHHFSGKLRCVFGAGGNRDVGKRPLMGEIAQRHADVVVLTDDNPRFEDGDSIIAQIASGFDDSAAVMRERDRRLAIERAILGAQPGDIVLLAGKGHEPYQEIRGERVPFDDVACALESLQRRALKVPL